MDGVVFECFIALFFIISSLFFCVGWTLPENTGNTTYNNSYGNLLFKEGITTSETSKTYTSDGFQKITSPPLSFALNGRHYAPGTSLSSRGSNGYYWSRSAIDASSSRNLYFHSRLVYPQDADYGNKSYGYSLRCVAW